MQSNLASKRDYNFERFEQPQQAPKIERLPKREKLPHPAKIVSMALVILAILVVSYLLARVTDLFVVGALVCSLGFLVYFRCRKPSYYAITLTLAVAIWAAFRFVLNVDF